MFPYIPPNLLRDIASQGSRGYFLSNIGNALTVYDEESDGLITSNADENGFRNEKGLYSNTQSFDVFLIGDSFTEGCCVPDGFTIADYIRQDTAFSVYNAGKNGAGLIHKLAVFIEYGLSKKPKNVVLIMPEAASLNRSIRELRIPQLRQYYEEHGSRDLLEKARQKDELLKAEVLSRLATAREERFNDQYGGPNVGSPLGSLTNSLNANSRIVQLIHSNRALVNFLRFLPENDGTDLTPVERFGLGEGVPRRDEPEIIGRGEGVSIPDQPERRLVIMEEVVTWLDGRIREYGGTLFVVYIPKARCFAAGEWPEWEHQMVIEPTRELDIELIDLVPVFDDGGRRNLFAYSMQKSYAGGHPNREGYRLIADQIVERLLTNNNVP